MIQSKNDYIFYLKADQIALSRADPLLTRPRPFQDEIWRFERQLRKVEFFENCKKNRLGHISGLWARFTLEKLSVTLGFTISPNCFGPGLSIAHRGTIVVHPRAKIGENCRIHQCVTIGDVPYVAHDNKAPRIGNNVFIGPGTVIVGNVYIADGVAIGANSYVDRSFEEPNITIAGCPAKKVSQKGSANYLVHATEILRR
jgi:serine O-acetyltransferase